jgi:hypothetical protein
MSGFVASGRIASASPRLARPASEDGNGEPVTLAASRPDRSSELIEVVIVEPLSDRWAAIRDRWTELTFYLFDPQSWR